VKTGSQCSDGLTSVQSRTQCPTQRLANAIRGGHVFVYIVVEWKMAQRETYKSTADVLELVTADCASEDAETDSETDDQLSVMMMTQVVAATTPTSLLSRSAKLCVVL